MNNTDINKFILREEYFDFQSVFHGIHHTYRVMCNCFVLGDKLGLENETKLAFCSAFIHDMARTHDGVCDKHGLWAAETKLPVFEELFFSIGVKPQELETIKAAVTNHCETNNLPESSVHYKTSAILKDADALDRVRFGGEIKYLRFKESLFLIGFAEDLYRQSNKIKAIDITDIMEIVGKIARPLLTGI